MIAVDLQDGDNDRENNKSKTLKICGIALLLLGAICIIVDMGVPFIFDSQIQDIAYQMTILTKANEDLWAKTMGGTGDLDILRTYYLYNCTNSEDVLYKGATPEYKEVGPYVYKELN